MSITLSAPERQKLKVVIAEITNSFLRIDSEKEAIKDLIATASEEFEIEKRMVRKIATVMYKSNYHDMLAEQEDFEYLYESIVEGKKEPEEANVTPIRSSEGS